MSKKYYTYTDLVNHPFSKIVFEEGIELQKEIYAENTFLSINPSLKRIPNEYEHYILNVGSRLARLFVCILGITNIIELLSQKTPNAKLKKKNITTYDLIIYHLENYIIRVQSVYDRVLFLIDALFHLGNSEQNIEHLIIAENIFVKRSKIYSPLKSLRKLLNTFTYKRNIIIHQKEYQEDDLRRLEFYCMFQGKISLTELEHNAGKEEINYIVNELSKKIVKEKLKQFSNFNYLLFERIYLLLSESQKEFITHKERIRI